MCKTATTNMKQIVSKLPYKLREKWRAVVSNITEQTQQRPTFNDLVKYVERQVQIMQDPVFGNSQDARKELPKVRVHMDTPSGKSGSKKSSFVTAVSPVNAVDNSNTKEKANEIEWLKKNGF